MEKGKFNALASARAAEEKKKAEQAAQEKINQFYAQKREAYSVSFLQAIIMSGNVNPDCEENVKNAIAQADALISQLFGIRFEKKVEEEPTKEAEGETEGTNTAE